LSAEALVLPLLFSKLSDAGMKRSPEHHSWAEPYRLAVFEENAARMPERIAVARSAILSRVEALQIATDHTRELQALHDALKVLQLLTSELRRTTSP
jgi:hypothetical protein